MIRNAFAWALTYSGHPTIGALARHLGKRALLALIRAVALVSLLLGGIGLATYETRYVDASGSRCLSFTLGSWEADTCAAPIDRPTLGTPPLAVDAACYAEAVKGCSLDASTRFDAGK